LFSVLIVSIFCGTGEVRHLLSTGCLGQCWSWLGQVGSGCLYAIDPFYPGLRIFWNVFFQICSGIVRVFCGTSAGVPAGFPNKSRTRPGGGLKLSLKRTSWQRHCRLCNVRDLDTLKSATGWHALHHLPPCRCFPPPASDL
jgi:hypothetical protein